MAFSNDRPYRNRNSKSGVMSGSATNRSELRRVRHSRSMSPMRGDVKEKFFPLPLRGETDVATCIQPDLRSEEALGS